MSENADTAVVCCFESTGEGKRRLLFSKSEASFNFAYHFDGNLFASCKLNVLLFVP